MFYESMRLIASTIKNLSLAALKNSFLGLDFPPRCLITDCSACSILLCYCYMFDDVCQLLTVSNKQQDVVFSEHA